MATVRARLEGRAEEHCIVVSESHVVLGALYSSVLQGDGDRVASEVMRSGPSTVRANEDLEGLLDRMRTKGVHSILVTDPDGKLLGALFLDDADASRSRPVDQGKAS